MKIKNIQYYYTALMLATTVSLTSCSSNNQIQQSSIVTTNSENSISTSSSIVKTKSNNIKDIINEINLYFNTFITISYYEELGLITIQGPYENRIISELTDELYQKLNELLEQPTINTLEIRRLGNEIDFSKLNLSKIKNITLDDCKTSFNYEPLKKQNFENYIFENIKAEQAIELIKNTITSNTNIDYINYNPTNEASNFICLLSEQTKPINNLYIATTECDTQDYSNLSKINAKNIEIMFSSLADQIYNLEFYPNENIESLMIWNTGSNIELGNIQVITNYPSFDFSLNGYDSKITENTHFSLPDSANVSISSSYDSGDSLKELSNVDELSYYNYVKNKEIYYYKEKHDFNKIINEFLKSEQYQYKKELQ